MVPGPEVDSLTAALNRAERNAGAEERRREREEEKKREKERKEKEKRRKKDGLPPLKERHIMFCTLTIWIGKVSTKADKSDLDTLFQDLGIETVDINMIPPRGCAYILLGTRKEAARAIEDLKDLQIHS